MGKSLYKVSYVPRGMEGLWREFWAGKGELSKEAKAAHKAGHLGRAEHIQAANLKEAISMVQRMHPDCTALSDGAGRIGG